jgi:hypothetical protein
MLVLLINYDVEIVTGGMVYMPGFMMIGSGVETL